jgi:Leucine-rich repeat (LRR) protein
VTNEGIRNLTKLKCLDFGSYPSNITFDGISNLMNLEEIQVNQNISDEIKVFTKLTSLSLPCHCSKISDEGIKNLTNLTHLEISNSSIRFDEGICITPHLFRFDDFHTITREGLRHLTKLVDLSKIDLK